MCVCVCVFVCVCVRVRVRVCVRVGVETRARAFLIYSATFTGTRKNPCTMFTVLYAAVFQVTRRRLPKIGGGGGVRRRGELRLILNFCALCRT